jgi:flavin reductase (DIM6/NTAB) family NADH-FMN oxidoreductase RutF
MASMFAREGGFMGVEVDLFKAGMRRLAGHVCVISTAARDGSRNGLTATAVASVTVAPPTLLCCINRTASAFDTVKDAGRFVVNVMPESEREIATRFAGGDSGEARFITGDWITLATGAPALASALVAFDCKVSDIAEIGSHGVFFGEVQAVHLSDGLEGPLLYLQGSYGGFAELR